MKMAFTYWPLILLAVVLGALTFALPILFREIFPWQKLWAQRHGRPIVKTASYNGRTVLITGANGAYGSRAAGIFATRGAGTIILVDVRDASRVKKEIEDEAKASGQGVPVVHVWQIDMMTFAGCRELGRRARELKNLDHALMTMGILSFERKESPEGWETSIQVNYLSNACAGLLLLSSLKASPGNPNPPVLTFITSFGIYPAMPTMSMPKTGSYLRHLSNNKDGMAQAHQYGRSKGLLLYFARELAARTSRATALSPVTITSADPGTAWTGLTQPNRGNPITKLITDFGARDAQIGAVALVNGVSAPASAHGKILIDFGIDSYPPFMERASGYAAQQRVWLETRDELEKKVPEVRDIYEMLDQQSS